MAHFEIAADGDITLDSAGRIDLSADDAGEVRLFDGFVQVRQHPFC